MFIRFLQDHDGWVYSARRGQLIDVEGDYAATLIDAGVAEPVATAAAITELTSVPAVEQAVDEPAAERAVAEPGPIKWGQPGPRPIKRGGRPSATEANPIADGEPDLFS